MACWIALVRVSPQVLNGYINLTLYAIVIINATSSEVKESNEIPSTLEFLLILRIWGRDRTQDPAMTTHPMTTATNVLASAVLARLAM